MHVEMLWAAFVLGSSAFGALPSDLPSGPDSAPLSANSLATNRTWDVLSPPEDLRAGFREAGARLGHWVLDVAGVELDGPRLVQLANRSKDDPFVRVVREALCRPVDPEDLLRFVDDVLAAEGRLRAQPVVLTPSRARSAGIFVHPREVFHGEPREYGEQETINIDRPQEQTGLEPALDGEVLGPRWTRRYLQPETEEARLAALRIVNPSLADRVELLTGQLRRQGAEVEVESTVRSRERGYLIYGSFFLSRAKNSKDLRRRLRRIELLKRRWKLRVPIRWRAPAGWQATIEAARQMAETYNVVYATERGAKKSNHYDGLAIDLIAFGLPRQLDLTAPDGTRNHFDLSAPEETRDLSLSPAVVDWIETHFELEKLEGDYPHWDDARE